MNIAGSTFEGGAEIRVTEDFVICHSQTNWGRERIGVGVDYQSPRLNAVFVGNFRVIGSRHQEFHNAYGLLLLFHCRMIVVRGPNQPLSKDQITILFGASLDN